MNNSLLLWTLMAFLLYASTGLTKAAAETVGDWGKNFKLSTLAKAEVKDFQGEKLGEIEDFVMDLQTGQIALVIFSSWNGRIRQESKDYSIWVIGF